MPAYILDRKKTTLRHYYIHGSCIKSLGFIKILFVQILKILLRYTISNTVLVSGRTVFQQSWISIKQWLSPPNRIADSLSLTLCVFFITKSSEFFYIHISTHLSVLSQDSAYILLWYRCIVMLYHWNIYGLNILQPTSSNVFAILRMFVLPVRDLPATTSFQIP